MVLGPRDHIPSRRKLDAFLAPRRRRIRTWWSTRCSRSRAGTRPPTRLVKQGVTGIVCASDILALGAIRAVRRAGLSVPDDVSVIGYDDSAMMNCTEPPLTTVRQPIDAMGRAAVDMLVALIERCGPGRRAPLRT